MEVSAAQKQKQTVFELASVSELSSSSSTLPPSPVVARFGFDSGASVLRFHRDSESNEAFHIDLRSAQVEFHHHDACHFRLKLWYWLSSCCEVIEARLVSK